jgi:dCMP deaminase
MKEFLDNLIEECKISVVDSEFARDMLREAYDYAYVHSTDESTKTGAVIVMNKEIVSRGTNEFAENVEITEKRNTSISKRVYQDHSERNAIYTAAKLGIALDDAHMYSTWIPCPACVNAIINSSINKLVIHYDMAIKTKDDWADDFKESIKMMMEAKDRVEISVYKGKIGDCKGVFKGKIWEP